MQKKCSKCGTQKPLADFYREKTRSDGRQTSCKPCQKTYKKKWIKDNPSYHTQHMRVWREENREKCREYQREYGRRRRQSPKYRVDNNISRAMRKALGGKKQGRAWEDLVGYTIDDLMESLENQFEDWMCWENFGKVGTEGMVWNIDHIKPRSAFDYKTPEDPEFQQCWALENLQPLEAVENIKKSNTYEQHTQA